MYKDPNNEGKNEINPSKNSGIFVICEKSFEFKIKKSDSNRRYCLRLTRRGKKHVLVKDVYREDIEDTGRKYRP